MRMTMAPAGLVPVLLAGLVGAGPAAASVDVAPGPAAPASVVSWPTSGDLPTAVQMTRGLLAHKDLPSGYTRSEEGSADITEVPGSGLCREAVRDQSAPMAHVHRTFKHSDGTMIAASITATGSRLAHEIVDATASAPTRCPIVVGGWTTKKHSPLPIRGLDATSAGLDEMFQDYVGEWSRYYHVVVAQGDVTAIFVEMRGTAQSKARFLKIVKAAVRKLQKIA